ncbi:MAG: DUF2461 domain-containing protein [Chloroflexi bacterium]|nr:MAG: DUF2461 domain-containing protein [Chloroflexota bacterium]
MTQKNYITPELFDFFREIKQNNNRDWFAANKARFESVVREPLLQFIVDFGVRLAEISPHFVADARKSGGSLFRIYRDVRFSKDKVPYKTAAGVQFRHERGKDVHAPGFYLHLEPDSVFIGAGIWHPDNKTLSKIRDAIVENPESWQAVKHGQPFAGAFQLGGDSLKRAPKGYDPDHPMIEDLRRKDFIASRQLSETDACRPDFVDRFAEDCRKAAPFVAFLTRAIGLAW